MYTSINNKVIKNPEESAACKLIRKVINKVAKVQPIESDEVEILASLPGETVIDFGNEESATYHFTAAQLVNACKVVNSLPVKDMETLQTTINTTRESLKVLTAPADMAHESLLIPVTGETKVKKSKAELVKINPFAGLLG